MFVDPCLAGIDFHQGRCVLDGFVHILHGLKQRISLGFSFFFREMSSKFDPKVRREVWKMMGFWSGDLSLRSQSYFLPGKNEEFFKTRFFAKCCIGSYSLANELKMLDIFGGFPANVKPPAQDRAFQSSRKAWLVAIENHFHHAFAITCLHDHFNIKLPMLSILNLVARVAQWHPTSQPCESRPWSRNAPPAS